MWIRPRFGLLYLKATLCHVVLFGRAILLLNGLFDHLYRTDPISAEMRFAGPLPLDARFTTGVDDDRPLVGNETKANLSAATSLRFSAHQTAAQFLEEFSLYGSGRGMNASPNLTAFYHQIGCDQGWKGHFIREFVKDATGLYSGSYVGTGIVDREQADIRIVVTSCAICHFGRVAGKDVPGLGNKNIDPYALGEWITTAESGLSWLPSTSSSPISRALQANSLTMAERLRSNGDSNTTQGLVPSALVMRWFYEQSQVPFPTTTPGAVKVPAFWGYGEKIASGIFCDGFADGHDSAWAGMVELAAGNSTENIRRNLDRIEHAEALFGSLLPPAYPQPINPVMASRGHSVYKEHCQQCHGQYARDEYGWPIYETPIHIACEEVGTDPDRLNRVTAQGFKLIAKSPLNDVIRTHPDYRRGYFAPRLEGIWARFPYLHNASVPNISALLTQPELRPTVFDLTDAGELYRFDSERLGLSDASPQPSIFRQLSGKFRSESRATYDTRRLGQSNAGHNFGTDLSIPDKKDLIEYLKTL